nr:hypothetical protein [Pseudomonadota bacterium]
MSVLLDSLASAYYTTPRDAAQGDAALSDAAVSEAAVSEGGRRAALDAALRDGLPHARSEAWKYTPLRSLERRAFAPADVLVPIDAVLIAHIPSPRLVFVNGRFDAMNSDRDGLPGDVAL